MCSRIDGRLNQSLKRFDRALERGDLAVVYTTRDLVSGEDNLAIGQKVSDGLVAALQQVQARPRFVIAKGAITSHDLAQPDRRRPFASGAKLRIALDKRAHDIAVESARCRALSSGVGAAKRMRARPSSRSPSVWSSGRPARRHATSAGDDGNDRQPDHGQPG